MKAEKSSVTQSANITSSSDQKSRNFLPFTGTPDQVQDCVDVRLACEAVARILVERCPDDDDRQKAISSLKYAVQQAIGCIVLNHSES